MIFNPTRSGKKPVGTKIVEIKSKLPNGTIVTFSPICGVLYGTPFTKQVKSGNTIRFQADSGSLLFVYADSMSMYTGVTIDGVTNPESRYGTYFQLADGKYNAYKIWQIP